MVLMSKERDTLFVKSKVREFIKDQKCSTAANVLDGDVLNDAIADILSDACRRAKLNQRKTVMEKDI